jgi:hypothetical protein
VNTFTEGALIGIKRQTAIEAQRRQNQVVRVQGCQAAVSATPDIKIKVRKC